MAKAIRLLLLAAALLAPPLTAPAQAGPTARASIYGGSPAAIADFPFQVALLVQSHQGDTSPFGTQFCGGFVLDATHIGTAAHCVKDRREGLAVDPSQLRVLSGTSRLHAANEAPPPQHLSQVTAVAFRPGFDPARYDDDAAVLTLADPLPGPAAKVDLLPAGEFSQAAAGDLATVTGWGLTKDGRPADLLQVALPIVADNHLDCSTWPGYVDVRMLCAGGADNVHDSCSGDSGGPLVVPAFGQASPPAAPTGWRLAGIVSYGDSSGCAIQGTPGVYAEVLAGGAEANRIDEFLQAPFAPDAPRTPVVDLHGSPYPGEVLECDSAWTNATSLEYRMRRTRPDGSADEALLDDRRYPVSTAELGWKLQCLVTATGPGGYGSVLSREATVVSAPAPAPAAPPPSQPVAPVVEPPRPTDTTRPGTALVRRRCSRTQCSLQLQVTDPPFTSGIRSLRGSGTLAYRGRCRRNGRTRVCTRQRRLSVKPSLLAAGRFVVRVRSRTAGLATLRFVAYDIAGNRQARATQVRVRFGPRR